MARDTGSLNRARNRRILVQGSMRSSTVVIFGIRFEYPAQMRLAQNNDVVHPLTPDRSDQPFGKTILPGRSWCGGLVPDAHGAQSAGDNDAIDPVAIADQVVRSLIPRKGLRDLTRNPFCRRICRGVDPDEFSAVQPDDDEGIEQVETDSRDNEQIHRGNLRRVIAQEGSPSRAGRPAPLDHVFGNARLRHLKPKLEQFALDTWRAPKRISTLVRRIKTRSFVSICGRPPNGHDRRAAGYCSVGTSTLKTALPKPFAWNGANKGGLPSNRRNERVLANDHSCTQCDCQNRFCTRRVALDVADAWKRSARCGVIFPAWRLPSSRTLASRRWLSWEGEY